MTLAIVHWGRTGGGPRFHSEVVRSVRAIEGDARQSVSSTSEYASPVSLGSEDLEIRTFRGTLGALLGLVRLPAIALRWRRWLRKNDIDGVIVSMEQLWQSLVCPLATPRHVKYVFILHDPQFHSGEGNLLQRIGRFLELRRADRVVVMSPLDLRTRRQFGDHRIVVSRLPAFTVNDHVASVRADRSVLPVGRPIKVGFIGRFGAYKGLDTFAELALLMRRDHPTRFSFVAYGSGPLDLDVTDEARAAVSWHQGWLSDTEFEAELADFDVLLLPYHEATQSGPASMAMSLGIPIVCTPVGGLPAQVEGAAAGVVSEDVSAASLARALIQLTTGARYVAASRAGFEASQTTFSWGRLAHDLVAAAAH